MSVRRALVALAVALLTPALLAGCGGSKSPSANGSSTPTPSASATGDVDGSEPLDPGDRAIQKPKARATIKAQATMTAVPGAGELEASGEAPRTIQGFPIPEGAKVKDPGAIEETWQFDIHTDDPAEVIAFYKRVLPQMGYTVRTDVTYTIAYEDVHWDIVFDGPVSGSMSQDPENGVVFVVVNAPGQPALPGD